jgi:hypothetical protein
VKGKIIWLLMVCMMCACSIAAYAGVATVFSEDFKDSAAAMKKLNLNPDMWKVSDGILHSRNTIDNSAIFSFGDANWKDYDVEFKIRRLEVNPRGQHFSIYVRCDNDLPNVSSGLRFYCTNSMNCLETVQGKTIRHLEMAGILPKPMEVGEKSPWSTFKVAVKDRSAVVYVGGASICKIDNVVPSSGKLAFFAYNVKVEITDLKVTVFSKMDGRQESKISCNRFPNSSFEFCTQDRLPDYWGCRHWGIYDPYYAVHFDDWTKFYGTDSNTAFDGSASMRISNSFDRTDNDALCLRSMSRLGPDGLYTISAYMKSTVPGMRVNLAGKEVALTTDWQRYSTVLDYRGSLGPEVTVDIYPLEKGVFWVDAVQMEEGSQLTPYVASLQDTLLAMQSKEEKQDILSTMHPKPQKAMTNIPDKMEVMVQYDCYTCEPEILVRIKLNPSDRITRKAGLIAEVSKSGRVILNEKLEKLSTGEMYIKIPGINKLWDGEYTLSVKCLDAEGKCFASWMQNIQKLAPVLHEVKVDKISRMLMVDGKPFIPVGYVWAGDHLTSDVMKYLKANGSNTICVACENKDKLKSILDNAENNGLKIVVDLSCKSKECAEEFIRDFCHHPALLYWLMYDEVFGTEWGQQNYNLVFDTLKVLKKTDPYHPVSMNEYAEGLFYLAGKRLDFPGDLVSIDYYAYPPLSNIAATADLLNLMQEIGRKDGRPSLIYLFGSGYGLFAPREFTSAEQEYSTYLSVISGATGVIYFASHPKSKSNWSAICRLMREITKLTPVIASPLEVPVVECSSPAVKFTVRKHDGALYLIAVNGSKGQVSATFDLSGATALKGGAEVLFEGRKATLKNNVLADTFAGYQRHVYRVDIK